MDSSPPPAQPAPEAGPQSAWATPGVVAWLVLLAIVAFIYAPVSQYSFCNFDDPMYLTANAPVARGLSLSGIRWAFTTTHTGMWHPLTWLAHMLGVQLFGLNPGAHHTINALLHFLNAGLLFTFLRLAAGSLPLGLAAAALFASHPLNVEAVAWASQLKSMLSASFFFLTLILWTRYVRSPSRRAYALVLGACLLGLMAKPMLATVPFVLLILDVWPLRRAQLGWLALVKEKLPFFALALASAWMMMAPGLAVVSAGEGVFAFSRVFVAAESCLFYIGKAVWPSALTIFYPPPAWTAWRLAAALVVLSAATVLAWKLRSRRPAVLAGWLWFLAMLLPVSGIIEIGPHNFADRYFYLPGIGLILAVTGALSLNSRPARLLLLLLTVLLTAASARQVRHWENSLTLWQHALRTAPSSSLLWTNLGDALRDSGANLEAAECFRKAIQLAPCDYLPLINLAVVYERLGRGGDALGAAQRAAAMAPGDAKVLTILGSFLRLAGRDREALSRLSRAVELNPDLPEPWTELGILHAMRGRREQALSCFERALRIRPDSVVAAGNLKRARAEAGRSGAGSGIYEPPHN